MSDTVEVAVAKAIAPRAWAALDTRDSLANLNRRKASLRHARAAISAHLSALKEAGMVVTKESDSND